MPDANPKTASDTLRRANVANIVKKLQAGKTLTKTEQEALAEHTAAETGTSTRELAAEWGLLIRQAQKLIKDGVPLDDKDGVLSWYLSLTTESQRKLTPEFARRIMEIRRAKTGIKSTEDWEEFLAQAKHDAETSPKLALAEILQARDFAAYRFKKAAKEDNRPDMNAFANLLAKFEGVVHDAELRAKKLGLDAGELLPRPEVERILWALAFWLLRSTDAHLDSLTAKLRALSPGLDGEPVRSALEGELLSARFLEPFVHAAKVQSGVGLPAWVIAKMREACGDFLEGGSEQFDEAIKP